MEMVNVKINGREYSVPQNSTVLEAARYAGVEIPTLCYLKDINEIGACRLCLVEVKGARGLVTACLLLHDRLVGLDGVTHLHGERSVLGEEEFDDGLLRHAVEHILVRP